MDILTQQQFEQVINQKFSIQFNNETEMCELIEVKSINAPQHAKSANQFSIVFKSNNNNIQEQGVYPISNDSMSDISLFLVPVYGNDDEVHYEAVFT